MINVYSPFDYACGIKGRITLIQDMRKIKHGLFLIYCGNFYKTTYFNRDCFVLLAKY